MVSKNEKLMRTAAWAFVAGLAVVPSASYAQEQASEPAAAAEEERDEVVVVTGSRIRQSEFTSPSPIQVLTTDTAELSGVSDTASFLQGSSLAAGSGQIDSTISSAFVTDGGPGSATLSLRGLGANRTLVLLNGRRLGPAGVRGGVSAVDLNVIPQGSIDRVEILKDGASSIYGSDAIAGVANIITRRDTDGIEVEVFGNLPTQDFNDAGSEFSADAVYGKSFDRGHIQVSLNYYHSNELKFGDREYLSCGESYIFNDSGRADAIDPRTNEFVCRGDTLGGQHWLYEFVGGATGGPWATGGALNSPNGGRVLVQYDGSGQIGQFAPGSIFPTPEAGNPYSWPTAPEGWFALAQADPAANNVLDRGGPVYLNQSLIPEVERFTAFVDGAFELTSSVEAYGEVLLNRRTTRSAGFRQVWTYVYTEDLGDPFSAGWGGLAFYSPTAVTDHNKAEQVVDYMRALGGFRGDFGFAGRNVSWDLSGQFSRSDGDYTQDVILQDAVWSADGRSDFGSFGLFNANSIERPTASCVGYNTPISDRPCVDVDWMSARVLRGDFTAEERAFLFDEETGNTVYDQAYLEGILSTDLFKVPAGMVAGAVGFHYRKDEIEDVPGAVTRGGNSWGLSSAGITAGEDTTKEVFGELSIPILAGLPLFEELTGSVSGRYTDVESSGEANTYKFGANWQITPSYALRATKGTSFRAPALFELYLADESSFPSQRAIDPCINWQFNLDNGSLPQRIADNCAADGIPGDYGGGGASATALRRGGAGYLKPETSEAFTVGAVWSPSFIDLNVSVDYVEIEIEDQVATLGSGNIVSGCYNSETFPTDPLCTLFDRGITGNPYIITEVRNSFLNINSQSNRAIDLTMQYRHQFAFGDFSGLGQFTWTLEDEVALFAGNTVDFNGRVGEPDFVGNLDLRFEQGDLTYFWGIDMVGVSSAAGEVGDNDGAWKVSTEFYATHDVSVRYRADDWSFSTGISNISDEQPPSLTRGGLTGQYSTIGTSALSSQYDYVGRRLFARISKSW